MSNYATFLWIPSHCQCIIECKHDLDLPDEFRQQEFSRMLAICARHVDYVQDGTGHFDMLMKETTRFQRFIARAIATYPTLFDTQGRFLGKLTWVKTAPRTFQVTIDVGSLLTATQKNQAQTWCNNNIDIITVVIK